MKRFVLMSDTHGCHRDVVVPDGDVILHAGDVCDRGNQSQVDDFLEWFDNLEFEHKICISGNHDVDLKTGRSLFPTEIPPGIIRLDDSGLEIGSLKIWGCRTGLKGELGDWSSIPQEVDILMTHYPPAGILDQTKNGNRLGIRSLANRVLEISPKIHLFGDIHHSHGQVRIDSTHYFNASLYKASRKEIIHEPYVIDLNSA